MLEKEIARSWIKFGKSRAFFINLRRTKIDKKQSRSSGFEVVHCFWAGAPSIPGEVPFFMACYCYGRTDERARWVTIDVTVTVLLLLQYTQTHTDTVWSLQPELRWGNWIQELKPQCLTA